MDFQAFQLYLTSLVVCVTVAAASFLVLTFEIWQANRLSVAQKQQQAQTKTHAAAESQRGTQYWNIAMLSYALLFMVGPLTAKVAFDNLMTYDKCFPLFFASTLSWPLANFIRDLYILRKSLVIISTLVRRILKFFLRTYADVMEKYLWIVLALILYGLCQWQNALDILPMFTQDPSSWCILGDQGSSTSIYLFTGLGIHAALLMGILIKIWSWALVQVEIADGDKAISNGNKEVLNGFLRGILHYLKKWWRAFCRIVKSFGTYIITCGFSESDTRISEGIVIGEVVRAVLMLGFSVGQVIAATETPGLAVYLPINLMEAGICALITWDKRFLLRTGQKAKSGSHHSQHSSELPSTVGTRNGSISQTSQTSSSATQVKSPRLAGKKLEKLDNLPESEC